MQQAACAVAACDPGLPYKWACLAPVHLRRNTAIVLYCSFMALCFH
jgi:hypothetical protein